MTRSLLRLPLAEICTVVGVIFGVWLIHNIFQPNADTPNYKARDIDFAQALEEAEAGSQDLTLTTSSPLHIETKPPEDLNPSLLYRIPYQASLDGNTVEMVVEQAAFSESAVRYQVELEHVGGEFKDVNELFTRLDSK